MLVDETFYPEWDNPLLIEPEISAPLAQVGANTWPVHPEPEALIGYDRTHHRRKWGRGEPVVTPRLRMSLEPGELELYAGALERRLYRYAWSRVDALGTGLVDAPGLVQDALIERWGDPRDLDDTDTERFAIRAIWAASSKAYRAAETRADLDDEFDQEDSDMSITVLPDAWRDKIMTEFPPATAQALVLIFEGQYTQAEAAEEVGVNVRTLKRAFATLRSWKGDI